MPERPLLVAAYAAGAGLAAATLVYVFGPTYLLDGTTGSKNGKGRNTVGLSNPANDCFINSVLQALAGSPQLRLFLIKEGHHRKLISSDQLAKANPKSVSARDDDSKAKLHAALLAGDITAALKQMLDALNERPISRKTISARPLITAVERSFNTRVSRYQQDAQEFLQLLLERLADEHIELQRVLHLDITSTGQHISEHDVTAVNQLLSTTSLTLKADNSDRHQLLETTSDEKACNSQEEPADKSIPDAKAMPFLGKMESQIECLVCNFKPKSTKSDFVTLTLNVPSMSGSTTLDTCFDGVLKVEHIDGFRCDRCRLSHALQVTNASLQRTGLNRKAREHLQQQCQDIEQALREDPENPPTSLQLPPVSAAPTSRITKHMRIAAYPEVLAIHLSRSMWHAYTSSSKNMAKVSFQEVLVLGPLLGRKTYNLLAVVTHKGDHNSGHYETFRRQQPQTPYLKPNDMGTQDERSRDSSPLPSPRVSATIPKSKHKNLYKEADDEMGNDNGNGQSFSGSLPATESPGQLISRSGAIRAEDGLLGQPMHHKSSKEKRSASLLHSTKHRKRSQDLWWRISDDKIKECRSSDVLGMQREVYLLFYELQHDS